MAGQNRNGAPFALASRPSTKAIADATPCPGLAVAAQFSVVNSVSISSRFAASNSR
jgi:hypothetical protein